MVSSKRVASLCFLSVSNFVQGQERDTTGSPACAYIYVGSIARVRRHASMTAARVQWSTDRRTDLSRRYRDDAPLVFRALFFKRLRVSVSSLVFFFEIFSSQSMATCLSITERWSSASSQPPRRRRIGPWRPFLTRNDHDAGTHVPILRLPYAESSISRLGALPSSS